MADSLGRKRILVGSMVLYGLASLMATMSVTLGMLYVSRFIWGFAAAGPRTAAQAISGTVTPVGVGYLAYGTAGLACQLFAVRHQQSPAIAGRPR